MRLATLTAPAATHRLGHLLLRPTIAASASAASATTTATATATATARRSISCSGPAKPNLTRLGLGSRPASLSSVSAAAPPAAASLVKPYSPRSIITWPTVALAAAAAAAPSALKRKQSSSQSSFMSTSLATCSAAELLAAADRVVADAVQHMSGIVTTGREVTHSGRWLRSGVVKYTVPIVAQQEGGSSSSSTSSSASARSWEYAERTTRLADVGVDGVDIIALIGSSKNPVRGSEKSLVLVLNYRPPVGRPSLEFPAGLIDKGETPSQAALRELKEETGFTGVIREISKDINVDPWKSTENFHLVTMDIDSDDPNNATLKQELDEDENLVPIIVPVKNLLQTIIRYKELHGVAIESKLYGFAKALELASSASW
ncbi:hypothetical protein CAOG_07796 [Capsaspora owczarzaki ATCC 30864]|uniref:Nudix hydrolase domain-containing protein n=1 Tax=Capsaspora owczarzaki (strain ATCC 30864) TaxID=595528 RepID=A0A0D2URV4_CAPO3|nr:hypothetical protein CAOG_07796 [Capsaspora owczarzaki ATCC 30864]KJE97691.1 hypothetical protein CAOG_007796 [Capsaspora owczarzaki ATCC 30864]|eukprot:XP_004342869.1 hypothetical protein CAOG_07796 [Capsaspora owczarzaki ATCC 30864]